MNTLDFKEKLKYIFALFVGLLSGISLPAQNNDLQSMVSSINAYTSTHLKEKVYVHTDRNYYLCGEILWFKAYVENAINKLVVRVITSSTSPRHRTIATRSARRSGRR